MGFTENRLNDSQLERLDDILSELSTTQIIWLSGYIDGRVASLGDGETVWNNTVKESVASIANLTILYGTETGNCQVLAEKMAEKASFKNINTRVFSLYDYDLNALAKEENVAILVSTHGEGEVPEMAADFHEHVNDENAESLENVNFSVLALGDKTYKHFCKTGEDIHAALKNLGAFPVVSLVKCDVDYERDADIWMNNFLVNLKPAETVESTESDPTIASVSVNTFDEFSKTNPYMATVLEKVKITGSDSDKEVYHVELSLEGSGLEYEPGDSVGIFTKNPDSLVGQILEKTGFNPDQKVDVNDEEYPIKDALTYHLEITILTFDLLRKYQKKTQSQELLKVINDDKLSDEYLYGHDVLDLLEDFPYDWNANKLAEILRPIPPRLYSISSSMESVGEEVHATVSVVRYERKNRLRNGACSSHLSDEIEIDAQIPIYIDKNPSFKLPANGSKIIMVGAGTGIAPYRAFMQHRESLGINSDAWLFFGNRRIDSDFLYDNEWQERLETGYLTKMDVAFSRDQEEKIYVQHKLKENQKEVFDWIENGAHFYLCGDMKYMAKDVNKTLLEIIQAQGGISEGQAKKYVKNMKREKRFQADVY